jgi:uncharacterized protein involved in exopolysaccharide biosynthesis
MQANEIKDVFSLKSMGFILRHPWLIICPFVIVSSIVLAFNAHTTLRYRTSAILSFDVAGTGVIDSKMLQRRDLLLGRIMLGENIRAIIHDVWPELDESRDPIAFGNRINRLRSRKDGLRISKSGDLLTISFQDESPQLCYKVVSSAVNLIQTESKRASEKDLESGIAILKNQLEFYRNRMKEIDLNILAVQDEIREKAVDMSEQEKRLLSQILGKTQDLGKTDLAVQKGVQYETLISELNLELLTVKRRKEMLERRLQSGDIMSSQRTAPSVDFKKDRAIQEYDKSIANKQLELSSLLAQGYMPAHPSAIKIQNQIDRIKALKEARLIELRDNAPDPNELTYAEKQKAENALISEIEELDFQIELLGDKIQMLSRYQEETEESLKSPEITPGEVSDLALKLTELRKEKEISISYHANLRKQLEDAEIKGRFQQEEGVLKINIIEEPKIPLRPIPFQNLPKVLMGMMLAIGTGIGLAYTVDLSDNPVRSSSELRELLSLPVLASIDKISTIHEERSRNIRFAAIITGLILFALSSKAIVGFVINITGVSW